MNRYLILLLTILCFGPYSYGQDQDKEQLIEAIATQVIKEQTYEIEVDRVLPRRGRIRPIHGYSVKVNNDSINSVLPYFGRAYSIGYGGGEGLNFKADLKTYKTERLSKNRIRVSLRADSRDDHFTYTLTFFSNRKVDIHVIGINREEISFTGYLLKETVAK